MVKGRYYPWTLYAWDTDLKSFIIANLGKKNYTQKPCILCGDNDAHSYKNAQWAFHVKCVKKIYGHEYPNGGLYEDRQVISRNFGELDRNKKLEMLQFVQIKQIVEVFDKVTKNAFVNNRELNHVNGAQNYDFDENVQNYYLAHESDEHLDMNKCVDCKDIDYREDDKQLKQYEEDMLADENAAEDLIKELDMSKCVNMSNVNYEEDEKEMAEYDENIDFTDWGIMEEYAMKKYYNTK